MLSKYAYAGKLPKSKTHSENFESQKRVTAYDRQFIDKLLTGTRFKALYREFFRKAQWRTSIDEHEDEAEHTLVYCIEGEGYFYLGKRKYRLSKDRYFIFNSTRTHSVVLTTETLSTIVVDLQALKRSSYK